MRITVNKITGVINAAILLLCFSCTQFSDSSTPAVASNSPDSTTYLKYETVLEIDSEPVYYAGLNSYRVSDDVSEVNFTNVLGKHIYFVRSNFSAGEYNSSSGCIVPSQFSYVQDTLGLSKSAFFSKTMFDGRTNPDGRQKTKQDIIEYNENDSSSGTKRDFNFLLDDGNSVKTINFTAMAVRDNVIIWRITEEENGSETKEKVTKEMCEAFADKFEEILPYETELFGAKTERVFINTAGTVTDQIKYYTDLADFTNILIFDMEKVIDKEGVLGFFDFKDYNITSKGSNIGNILYVNDDGVYDSSGSEPKDSSGIIWDAYNTMAHEYMHSLQYGRKVLEQGQNNWNFAFGEMLGQLCEYAFGIKMGIPQNAGVIKFRFKDIYTDYFTSGLLDYNVGVYDDYRTPGSTYPVVLAFGIFLLQNYGGELLLSDMVSSADDGWDAIINGIRRVDKTFVTKEDLLAHFLEAYCCKGSEYNENMKNVLNFHARGETLSVKGIDPYDLTWNGYFEENDDNQSWVKNGIFMFPYTIEETENLAIGYPPIKLRPEGGFQVCDLGIATEDSIKITIENKENTFRNSDEVIFILIGDQ